MQICRIILGAGVLLFGPQVSMAFVLLSGAEEARLPVSLDNPTVVMLWDGSYPEISEKDKLLDGQFADMENRDLMLELLRLAAQRWNEIPDSYLTVEIEESLSAAVDPEDLRFSLVVQANSNATSSAFAAPMIAEDEPVIEDCDIVIGDRKTPAKSLAHSLIHELGHCIGLGHNHTNYGSIMGYSRLDRDLTLGADDVAGLVYLYPRSEAAPKEWVSCGTLGVEVGSMPALTWVLWLSPLLLAGARCRGTGDKTA